MVKKSMLPLFAVLLVGLLGLAVADDDYPRRGYGMGPGMMGGYGMGPGMMGGYGMGPGMMGGYGMMGGAPLWGLNLSDKQRQKITALIQEQQKSRFSQMQAMAQQMDQLHGLYSQARPDAEAIGKAHEAVDAMRRAHIVSGIKLRNQIYDVLSDEQRRQLYPAR